MQQVVQLFESMRLSLTSAGMLTAPHGSRTDMEPFVCIKSCIFAMVRLSANCCVHVQWEKSWLEAQLSAEFTRQERDELFQQWAIHMGSPHRKRQLIDRFWSPNTLK